jgi:hypothetical protein
MDPMSITRSFILLLLLYFVATTLCFVPQVAHRLGNLFDFPSFKAFKFISAIFAVFSFVLALLGWILQRNPLLIDREISWHTNYPQNSAQDELAFHYMMEDRLLWEIFTMKFSITWAPVITTVDKTDNFTTLHFGDNRGTYVSIGKVRANLQPNILSDAISGFFIPPRASFSLNRGVQNGRNRSTFRIKNKDIDFHIVLWTNAENSVCYVQTKYKKQSWPKYLLNLYGPYDRWEQVVYETLNSAKTKSIESRQSTRIFGSNITQDGNMPREWIEDLQGQNRIDSREK